MGCSDSANTQQAQAKPQQSLQAQQTTNKQAVSNTSSTTTEPELCMISEVTPLEPWEEGSELDKVLQEIANTTKQEKDCMIFLAVVDKESGKIGMFGKWKTRAGFTAHENNTALQPLSERIMPLVDSSTMAKTLMPVAVVSEAKLYIPIGYNRHDPELSVIVTLTPKDADSKVAILRDELKTVETSRKEVGCRNFDICTVDGTDQVAIFSLFGNQCGFDEHENSELIQTGMPKMQELLVENGMSFRMGRRVA